MSLEEFQSSVRDILPLVMDEKFFYSAASIAFNPIFWNIAAQLEYRTHFLTKISGGPYNGCYLLAATIFSLGIFRDYLFHQALETQPISPVLDNIYTKVAGGAVFAAGNILVLSSMWALGVTGTYLGDYFGILMDHIVTCFPFNVTNNPMYVGSYLSFIGTSLYYGKAGGFVLSMFVHIMYNLALQFEEPFTAKIYAARDAAQNKEVKPKTKATPKQKAPAKTKVAEAADAESSAKPKRSTRSRRD